MRGRRTLLAAKKGAKRLANSVRAVLAVRGDVPKVAIVSCDAWKGKVYDDLLLQGEFIRQGMDAKIVSWQDGGIKWGDFDALVIGAMWGYQNFLKDFEKWLDMAEKAAIVVNPVSVIRGNYDKAKQFSALKKAGVPVVETDVIKVGGLDDFILPEGNFVVKPAISGSGENTFLIKNSGDFEKLRSKFRRLNRERELLVQPFISEIREGELGVIMIGGEIMNVVRRFPGVIEGNYKVQLMKKAELSASAKELVKKVADLPEYKDASYLRIDIVEQMNGPIIMEVEALEPQLYYYLLKGNLRKKILGKMVAATKKALHEEKASAIH